MVDFEYVYLYGVNIDEGIGMQDSDVNIDHTIEVSEALKIYKDAKVNCVSTLIGLPFCYFGGEETYAGLPFMDPILYLIESSRLNHNWIRRAIPWDDRLNRSKLNDRSIMKYVADGSFWQLYDWLKESRAPISATTSLTRFWCSLHIDILTEWSSNT